MAYERLWNEFGPQHEMEAREIVTRRLAWHPAAATGNCWLRYELILVRRQGQFVAVRDHTAVTTLGRGAPHTVVHLSHVLVEAAWGERDWRDGFAPGRFKLPGLASRRRDFQRRLRSRWWRRWSIPIRTSRMAWSGWRPTRRRGSRKWTRPW